jgi:hypothetical protein
MGLRQIIRADIAASAIAHLALLALVLVISEVHPFHAAPSESVAVDLVTPDELVERAPEPVPPPDPDSAPLAKAEPEPLNVPVQPESPPPAPPAAARPQEQTASPPRSGRREANAQPQPAQPVPNYALPEPDITVKYGVMLGLPDAPAPKAADKGGDGGDAKASTAADLSSGVIAEFRRHLRKCSKLPASIAPSDGVIIKLRAVMTADGRLATDPILIEASASAKGPILMQSAKSALAACQPYTMLPADKYDEWRVMDLIFTPHDFDAS